MNVGHRNYRALELAPGRLRPTGEKNAQHAEHHCGRDDEPPGDSAPQINSRIWSLIWFLMIVAIIFYSGQSSKFIYIDF